MKKVDPVPAGAWKKKNGQVIRILDMDDEHLTNAINMSIQTAPILKRQVIRYLESTSWAALEYSSNPNTPDGASMAAEQEANGILDQIFEIEQSRAIIVIDKVGELITEAQRRQLPVRVPAYRLLTEIVTL